MASSTGVGGVSAATLSSSAQSDSASTECRSGGIATSWPGVSTQDRSPATRRALPVTHCSVAAGLGQLGVEGRDGLAGGGAVRGPAARDAGEEFAAGRGFEPLGIHDVGAVDDPEVDAETADPAQVLQQRKRGLAQLESALGELAEFVKMQAEAVLPAVGVLLGEAAGAERREQPVGGALGDAQAAGDVGDAQLVVEGEAFQDIKRRGDRLERLGPGDRGPPDGGGCRATSGRAGRWEATGRHTGWYAVCRLRAHTPGAMRMER